MAWKNKNYINSTVAILLSVLLLWVISWTQYIYNAKKDKLQATYNKSFKILKENKNKEVNSPIRAIFDKISKSSDLVYNLSLFHTPPMEIINKIEKAIYIGKDSSNNYKIVTNENFSFSNYNKVTFGLISTDLAYYPELIKKLKKLYWNTFAIDWLKNFGIQRERDTSGKFTGKVFFTTSLTLKYLKDQNSNISTQNIDWLNNPDAPIVTVEGNKERLVLLSQLIWELATKRKDEWKKEFYFNSQTKDNSIYLGTDIEYNGNKDIYYLNDKNNLIDIFSLNKIGTKDDYALFRDSWFKAMMISKKDGSGYALCGKILKEQLTPEEQRQQDLNWTEFTQIFYKGTFTLDSTVKTFCSLL